MHVCWGGGADPLRFGRGWGGGGSCACMCVFDGGGGGGGGTFGDLPAEVMVTIQSFDEKHYCIWFTSLSVCPSSTSTFMETQQNCHTVGQTW